MAEKLVSITADKLKAKDVLVFGRKLYTVIEVVLDVEKEVYAIKYKAKGKNELPSKCFQLKDDKLTIAIKS